jgi:hypothetical protein
MASETPRLKVKCMQARRLPMLAIEVPVKSHFGSSSVGRDRSEVGGYPKPSFPRKQ